jgi:inosine/xanthosine triphosphatase
MKINIGSKNKAKIDALTEILKEYPDFLDAEVVPMEVSSGVSEQPKSLEEAVEGATNRAKNSFKDCDYSVGLESGIFKVPKTKTGYMDTSCCAIYDGKDFHLGLSSCFEYPIELTKQVLNGKTDISTAAKNLGITEKDKLGSEEGMIGILTKGRLDRKNYTKQALRTALIHLENKELY